MPLFNSRALGATVAVDLLIFVVLGFAVVGYVEWSSDTAVVQFMSAATSPASDPKHSNESSTPIQPQGPLLRQHRGSTGILKPGLLSGLLFIPIKFARRGSRECGPFRFQARQALDATLPSAKEVRAALRELHGVPFSCSSSHPRLIASSSPTSSEREM